MAEQIRLQIQRQRGALTEITQSIDADGVEKDGVRAEFTEHSVDGCRLGRIQLCLDKGPLSEPNNLAAEVPVRAYLQMRERPEKITAMYMFNPWWTRPAFVDSFQEIPAHTQIAFFKYRDRCACFLPVVGEHFKAYLTGGTETELCLEMTAGMGGQSRMDEPLYLFAEAPTVAEAVHTVFLHMANMKGIRLRKARRLPEMFRYLGWCSWDAFRTEVTEDKIRWKADELIEKQVPVKWMLIDDGWFPAQEKMICGFAPNKEKFPNGFQRMIADIREKGGVKWFGVWHALAGYWDGIAPESALAAQEASHLYRTVNGSLVPSPRTGAGFYNNWYKVLAREGIDFVKVDGQSSVPFYFENSLPVSEAARGISEALESGAYRMDGSIINCMGMAMENVLARPASALSRNSDDFVPDKENGFAEHLLQNAYNAIYHNEIYCCDWDMFWTKHEDAVKHSLLRAVSGGPVYFSDKIGDTVPEMLQPLTYPDGRILMMDRSARPTEDCVFANPLENGVLKLHNTAAWGEDRKGGGIAVYNLTTEQQTFAFTPADIPDLDVCGQYWVYDFFSKKVRFLGRKEVYQAEIESGGAAWYVILPQAGNAACFGLLDKYAGFSAVESIRESENASVMVLHAGGTIGWASGRQPRKVMLDSIDVTEDVEQSGNLYVLPRPETADKTVLSIIW